MDDPEAIALSENANSDELANEVAGVAGEAREAIELLPNAFLERLPAEITGLVFNWLRIILEDEGRYGFKHPLSRTLVPFVRRNLYHFVKIKSCHLLAFCDTVERHSLQSSIHSLVCGGVVTSAYVGVETDWRPHEDRLLRFFRSTVQLSYVHVATLPQLSLLLLSPKFASVCLPQLNFLVVKVVQPDVSAVLRFRRFYSRLEKFSIILDATEGVEEPSWIIASDYDGRQLPPDRVTSVTVEGEEGQLGSFEAAELVASFSAIKSCTFSLRHEHLENNLVIILENLNPANLTELSINAWECSSMPLDTVLLRFEGLQSLVLSGRIFEQALFPNLRRLPHLTTLELDKNHHITLSALESLLTGPTRMHSLREVEILGMLHWSMKRGESYLDAGHEFELDDEEPATFLPRYWQLPEWTDEFPLEDVKSFVALAKAEGIEVGDHMREMMDFTEEYEREVEQGRIYSRTAEGLARIEEMQRSVRL